MRVTARFVARPLRCQRGPMPAIRRSMRNEGWLSPRPRLRGRLRDGLAASGLTVAMTWHHPTPAYASNWERAWDGGLFLGVQFGNPRRPASAILGIEARGVLIDNTWTCDGHMQDYVGAVARAALIGWKDSRLTLGPVMGTTNGLWGYAGEATVGIERGSDPGFVFQVGGEVNALFLLNARAGYAFGRDGYAAVGVRVPPLSFGSLCVTGRPLRRHDARAPVAGAQWSTLLRSRASDERAALVWTERACLEWASVPAFCELAEQLAASGAPESLIGRARQAAADELRHAVISAQAVAALASAPVLALDPPTVSDRAVATGRAGLVRLAVESFLDGCLGEATAAVVAASEADLAGNVDLRRTQRTIACDEARHASLAWDIIDWTLAVHPEAAGAALTGLAASSAATATGARTATASQGPTLEGFGILDASRVTILADEQRARARARLTARLTA